MQSTELLSCNFVSEHKLGTKDDLPFVHKNINVALSGLACYLSLMINKWGNIAISIINNPVMACIYLSSQLVQDKKRMW